MKTVYLLYRKTNNYNAYPFAIDHSLGHATEMSKLDGVGYVELPYEEACRVYDNKLEVLEYLKETKQ